MFMQYSFETIGMRFINLYYILLYAESSEEYGAMVRDVMEKHPTSKLIAVGFSLGGSLVCKYLGENKENQTHFIACLSLCQGYNFQRCVIPPLLYLDNKICKYML